MYTQEPGWQEVVHGKGGKPCRYAQLHRLVSSYQMDQTRQVVLEIFASCSGHLLYF